MKLSTQPKIVKAMLSDLGAMSVLEVDGDLHVPGDFDTFKHNLTGLIVKGNLTVDGVYEDQDYPQTYVLVTGNLRADTVITSGQLEVKGDLEATCLCGDYNDHSATICGVARARVFYPEDHFFTFKNRPKFELVIGGARLSQDAKDSVVRPTYGEAWALLKDECFAGGDPAEYSEEDERYFDYERGKILELLRTKQGILRA